MKLKIYDIYIFIELLDTYYRECVYSYLITKAVPWWNLIERKSSKRENVGSILTVGKISLFCNSYFLRVSHSLAMRLRMKSSATYPVLARGRYVTVGPL